MKNAPAVILCMALCIFTPAFSQTLLTDFDLESARVDGIQAFPLDDSVLLTFVDRGLRETYWINKTGDKRKVDLAINPAFPLVGIQLQPDHTLYYYYLNDIAGQMVLQVMEQAKGTGELRSARPIFPIPGKLLGIQPDKTVVAVVTYLKKENRIMIFTIRGLRIQNENLFEMPFDASRQTKLNAGFMIEREMADLRQGDKTFKLYKEGDHVVVTIDEDQPGLENKKTTIIKMDPASGNKDVYTLQRNDYDKFVSAYFQDKLYQLSHSRGKYLRCDIYEVGSGKLLFSKMFEKDKAMKKQKVIVHRGKSVEVDYTSLYQMVTMAETIPSIAVLRTADSTQLRLSLGSVNYYAEPVFIPFASPLLNVVNLIILYITPVNSNVRYFTLTGNTESGFEMDAIGDNSPPCLQYLIDAYEISHTSQKAKGTSGLDLLFKGYVELDHGAIGIYHLKGRKIRLVKFP